uniref:Uncharacterized protein n=1 Tax=Arundo donax TaxID=35708 RepID=A0A0A9CLT7_ARUDO
MTCKFWLGWHILWHIQVSVQNDCVSQDWYTCYNAMPLY